jgi:hypothetical protein
VNSLDGSARMRVVSHGGVSTQMHAANDFALAVAESGLIVATVDQRHQPAGRTADGAWRSIAETLLTVRDYPRPGHV